MMPNVYQQYKQQSISTMTPGDLLIKLYDEFISQANRGMLLFEEGKGLESGQALLKCRKILAALNNALDDKYEVSKNLEMLYSFFDSTISKAALTGDLSQVKDVEQMARELRATFSEADKSTRINNLSHGQGLRVSG